MKKNFLEKKNFDTKKFNSITEQNIFNLFNKPKFGKIPKNENLKSNLKNFFSKIKNEKKEEKVENKVNEKFFKCENIGSFVKKISKEKKSKKSKKKKKLKKNKGGINKKKIVNDVVMDL